MSVEIATKVEDLVSANPLANDPVARGDDHIRLIKSVLLYTFAGAASTGVVGYNVVTQPAGNNTTLAASTAFVGAAIAAQVLSGAVPGGSNGQILYTIAGVPAWGAFPSSNTYASSQYINSLYGAF